MDIIMHIIGACSDNYSHIDITDMIFFGGGFTSAVIYMKIKIAQVFKRKK